jgi:hypothetical protein
MKNVVGHMTDDVEYIVIDLKEITNKDFEWTLFNHIKFSLLHQLSIIIRDAICINTC